MVNVTKENIKEILSFINPAALSYQEWVNVGMALKDEGFSCDIWDEWSKNDSRYHPGECDKKWKTFNGAAGANVTFGTVMQMAFDGGFRTEKESRELDWDDEIGGKDDYVIVDKNWLESQEIHPPKNFEPVKELTTYIETLFDSTDNVGFVTETWEKDGKYLPTKGTYSKTAGELIQELNKCNGDIGAVIGDYNPEAGAWIRFNPLDGKGIKNENVTDFRYALVESDVMEIDKQNAIIRELELPVAVLVYSGGKSLHAIVKVDAADYTEYRKRVEFLYMICKKNGLEIDSQNRNPSRLSRMPGVERKGQKQFIVDTNIGKSSFLEWKEWVEGINDDLPDTESLSEQWDNLPPLAEPLIDGVLRQGHKMLIAGPSKAGKSYALIELCVSIAEGAPWFGFSCAKGKVLYVNLELDRASCLHRFKDVYNALKIKPLNLGSIDIWNLRGKSVPMDSLAPKLIRRALKKNYLAIIIDPIYKVITGDENSADQMAHFCNQFDKVCTELGCAVIYCHHHSKGAQGGKKSMDRASGSGVFARDPDALLDLIELDITDALKVQQEDSAACDVCIKYLTRFKGDSWHDDLSRDNLCSIKAMKEYCKEKLPAQTYANIIREIEEISVKMQSRTAWRIEGTLREFPKFQPLNLWFDYPVHRADESGVLADIELDTFVFNTWQHKKKLNKKDDSVIKKVSSYDEKLSKFKEAFDTLQKNGEVEVALIEKHLNITRNTTKKIVDLCENMTYVNGRSSKEKAKIVLNQ